MLPNRKIVGFVTLISGVIGLVSYVLVLMAVNFNFEFFNDPSQIFQTEGKSSLLLKWSMITDLFGYYLLLVPVLFFIHNWMEMKTTWSPVFTFCGAAYIFAGALGASILGASWPMLIDKFSLATSVQQDMVKLSFENLSWMVGDGIWNIFDACMFGVWFIAVGVLVKRENKTWGWFTISIGTLSALDFIGNIFNIKIIADTALNLYLVLAPIWAILAGIAIRRNYLFATNCPNSN